MQDSIHEYLSFFKGFFATAPDGIVVFDTDYKVAFANEILNKGFNIQWGRDMTKGLDIFNDPYFKGFYTHKIENLKEARKGEIQKFKETFKISGNTYYHSVVARAVSNSSGKCLGIIVNIKDVSEYVGLSTLLKEREATLNAILNATPDGIYALDKALEVIAINKQAIDEFREGGFKVEKGTNLHDIVEEKKLSRWMDTYFSKVFNGEPIMYEGPLDKINGQTVHVQNKYRPVYNHEKEIFAILEISRDVTEAVSQDKIIQEQLKDLDLKNKELNRYIDSNLQLENFAYIASHDLKAPLRSVVSFAHLLKSKIYDGLDDKSKSYLDIVVKSSENMQELIDDLLTYSRVKTTKIKLVNLDLNDLLKRVLMELDVDIQEKHAQVVIPESLPTIMADESLLNQLFSNLIRNAIKFQAPGSNPLVQILFEEDSLFWKFEVKDNGIGISEKNFEKIFGTFEKLHSNDIYEGTGLGLTICRKIVEKHEGRIKVESKLDEGTSFSFVLSKNLKVPQLS